ncbi:MAG: acyltransferase family protein [Labedaea sp.]
MASTAQTAPAGTPAQVAARPRLVGLDGIRGLAALFVVVHHCWLMSFPGYPDNTGPLWTTPLVYGHLAVVVFIVLSGFSLAVGPARASWQLGSLRRFAFRRAWRILPPYWPALVFSLVIAWTVVPQPHSGTPTPKSVVVYGLLLQDVFGAPTPNGAFWSIAVEAQLYLVLPVLLLVLRRAGAAVMLTAVLLPVAAVGVLAPHLSIVAKLLRFTPQFAFGFAAGVVAAGVLRGDRARWPWHWLALGAAAPVLALIAIVGPVWTVNHYFWVDLAISPAIALLLAAVATGRPRPLVGFLDSRPLRGLGSFSYSLYLIHAPIVVAVAERVVHPHLGTGVAGLLFTLAISVPLTLVLARLFAAVFEIPFTRNKSWPALRAAIRSRNSPAPAA